MAGVWAQPSSVGAAFMRLKFLLADRPVQITSPRPPWGHAAFGARTLIRACAGSSDGTGLLALWGTPGAVPKVPRNCCSGRIMRYGCSLLSRVARSIGDKRDLVARRWADLRPARGSVPQ